LYFANEINLIEYQYVISCFWDIKYHTWF